MNKWLTTYDPYAYLHYLFTKAPPLITDEAELETLLAETLKADVVNKAFLAALR